MSNFRPINRDTGFLLPPSVDEWLPQRHLARFVVEVIDGLDLSELIKAYRGSGSASFHPAMLLGLVHRIRKGQFSLGNGTARGLSSLKHLWAHALRRRGARAQACSDESQPPMQQNSPVRLRTEHDVHDIKTVRYARKVTVGRGLYLLVTPQGGRCWHYRFTFAGKRKKLSLGTHPEISLEGAKTRHEYARYLLAHGIDPCETKATLGKNAFFLRIREWKVAQNPGRRLACGWNFPDRPVRRSPQRQIAITQAVRVG